MRKVFADAVKTIERCSIDDLNSQAEFNLITTRAETAEEMVVKVKYGLFGTVYGAEFESAIEWMLVEIEMKRFYNLAPIIKALSEMKIEKDVLGEAYLSSIMVDACELTHKQIIKNLEEKI